MSLLHVPSANRIMFSNRILPNKLKKTAEPLFMPLNDLSRVIQIVWQSHAKDIVANTT